MCSRPHVTRFPNSLTVFVRRCRLVRNGEVVLLVALVDVHHAKRALVVGLVDEVGLQRGQLLLEPATSSGDTCLVAD